MTVQELIEELNKLPPDKIVYILTDGGAHTKIETVGLDEFGAVCID